MPRKPATPVKDFFGGLLFLIGMGVLLLVLWGMALVVIAALIFAWLSAFTDWNVGSRIGCSLVFSFLALKLLVLIFNFFELIPESWIDAKKETKPCPECGKDLPTALAQQCIDCGADWHVEFRST